jgi:hypothetical protein
MAVTTSYNCSCEDTSGNETLGDLRRRMIIRLGWGAMVNNPPPGVASLCNDFLQSAQKLLHRRFAQLRTERFFSWPIEQGVRLYDLQENAEAATIATPAAPTLGTSGAGGTLPAGAKSYRIAAVNAHGVTLASTAAAITTIGATSTVTVTFPAVVAPMAGVSPQTGWRVYGRTAGAELLIAQVGLVANYVDTGAVVPAGALPTENTTYECSKFLDPHKVTWVGVKRDDVYYPLAAGIPPEIYSYDQTAGFPLRYEIRSCIELWPIPQDDDATLIVKGHFGLSRFTEDTDQSTVDSELIFTLAIANAKAHYRQPDANNYVAQMETMMQNLVAGSHTTRRYIPGRDVAPDFVYAVPKPTVPFA